LAALRDLPRRGKTGIETDAAHPDPVPPGTGRQERTLRENGERDRDRLAGFEERIQQANSCHLHFLCSFALDESSRIAAIPILCAKSKWFLTEALRMCTDMAKKASAKQAEPMKLFYIFYNQERWDNRITTLEEANFELAEGEEVSEGEQMLYGFTEDITLSVLKIIRLYQNGRFTKEEAVAKLDDVELIVMTGLPEGDLEDIVGSLQLSLLVLFTACRKYLESEFDKDIKSLVKKGRGLGEENLEEALEVAANIGAAVVDGATCCAKYIKDDAENPGLFDEWLIEIETMSNAMKSLAKFDEEPGEAS